MDVLPSTSIVTRILYGDEVSIWGFPSTGDPVELNLDEYLRLSTDRNNMMGGKYNLIEIYYPAEELRTMMLYDTPGFSSISEQDDNITKEWLNKVDILIWLFDAELGRITKDELTVLNTIKHKDVIAVVNKLDLKPSNEHKGILSAFACSYGFKSCIPYAADPILKAYAGKSEQHEALSTIIENIAEKAFVVSQLTSTITISKENIVAVIRSNDDTNSSIEFLLTKDFDRSIINLHTELLGHLSGLRKEIIPLKNIRLHEDTIKFYSREREAWQAFSESFLKSQAERKADIRDKLKLLHQYEEQLKQKVISALETYQDEFVDNTFDVLFLRDRVRRYGSDNTFLRMKKITNSDGDKIKHLLRSFTQKVLTNIIKESNCFFEEVVPSQSYENTENIIEFIREKCSVIVFNGISAMCDVWRDMEVGDNYENASDRIKLIITSVLSTNVFAEIIYEFLDLRRLHAISTLQQEKQQINEITEIIKQQINVAFS